MANTRKITARKATASKKAPARKKSTARSSAARTKTTRTTRAKSAPKTRSTRKKVEQVRSFRVAKQQEPFMSLKITVQTLYWLILAGAVLLLGLWVLNIHNRVQMIYDEIDQSQLIQQQLDAKEIRMLRERTENQE